MPSSLILSGGAAFTRTVKETLNQPNHNFVEGDVVRWDSTLSQFVKAQANNAQNAEVVGVVGLVLGLGSFEIVYAGALDVPSFSAPLASAPVLFLSATTPGKLETSPPSIIGSVIKPVLTKNQGTSTWIVNNFLGTQIGGSSTVAIDEIQPVGTIMPFAGGEIPASWLPCDGGSYSRTEYAELYRKLQFTDTATDQVPMYGYVATLTATGIGGIAVNDILHYKRIASNTWAADGPFNPASQDNVRAVVTAVTATTITVRVLPKYSGGAFSFSNFIFTSGTGFVSTSSPGNYRAYFRDGNNNYVARTTSSLNVSAVSLTHFLTPDLRGRFALGSSTTAVGEDTNELDTSFISSLGTYAMGSLGGEERHTLTAAEMASHTHSATATSTSTVTDPGHTHANQFPSTNAPSNGSNYLAGTNSGNNGVLPFPTLSSTTGISVTTTTTVTNSATGSNTPHNNMPPYVTVRYIIKATPYTRAAIIEGLDIPYSNLLVRDLRSQVLGGTSLDLQFYTNSGVGSGTLRMTLKGDTGRLGIAKTNPETLLDVNGTGAFTGLAVGKTSLGSGLALDVVGNIALTGKATSASTVLTDLGSTLVTKDYVDNLPTIKIVTFPRSYSSTPFTAPWTGVIANISGVKYWISQSTITLSPGNYRVHFNVNTDHPDNRVVSESFYAVQFSSNTPSSINASTFLCPPARVYYQKTGDAGHGRSIYQATWGTGTFTINTQTTGRIYLHEGGSSTFVLTGASIFLEKI
jgi:microcystin-dependent protein